jgi:hypothetical protein
MKTLLILISAGRCGSTNLINRLNKNEGINIYGENYGALLDLIKSANWFSMYKTRFINQPNMRLKTGLSSIEEEQLNSQINRGQKWIGNEFYNNHEILEDTLNVLNKLIVDFFKVDEPIVGFKEIRWQYYQNLNWLKHLETLPFKEIKYIKLNRNIEDQARSMYTSFNPKNSAEDIPTKYVDYLKRITDCENNINKFLKDIDPNKKYECNYVEECDLQYNKILEFIKND